MVREKETVKAKVSFFRAIAFMYQFPVSQTGIFYSFFFVTFPTPTDVARSPVKVHFLSGNNASPFVSQLSPNANNANASSQNIGLYSLKSL